MYVNEFPWIKVEDDLPPVNERVEISFLRNGYRCFGFASWHDGTEWVNEDDICWDAQFDEYYDEEKDDYRVPAGWLEEPASVGLNLVSYLEDYEKVTHWRKEAEFVEEE